jgi:hypothetical protein
MTARASTYDRLANVDDLSDPSAVEFVASQLNDVNQNQNRAQSAARIKDLTEIIIDIVKETAVQGSSTLEVHITDPFWRLTERPSQSQPAFIDVDDAGLLLPVDVQFPEGGGEWWRICACNPSTDTTGANLILTFENRSVSLLRDLGGPKRASNNQTRAQFIASCMRQVPEIVFVCPAISQPAGSVAGDITPGQINNGSGNTSSSGSTSTPALPVARANPTKAPGITRDGKHKAPTWTSNGWVYNAPIAGLSVKELSALNPPTDQPDG